MQWIKSLRPKTEIEKLKLFIECCSIFCQFLIVHYFCCLKLFCSDCCFTVLAMFSINFYKFELVLFWFCSSYFKNGGECVYDRFT